MNSVTTFLTSNATVYSLLICLGFIGADTLLGWIKAWKDGTFDFSKVPMFLASNVFPYMGGLIILALFSSFVAELQPVFYAGVALVSAKFGKDAIQGKLLALFNASDTPA